MKTSVQQQEVKALQIQTDKVTINADDKTAYVLIGVAGIVAMFFIWTKWGKHVKRVFKRR